MRNLNWTLAVATLLIVTPLYSNAQDILRDPTRPYGAKVSVSAGPGASAGSSVTTYDVTAIFTSDSRRVAVVNGQRVIEGDQVDGATVTEILADSLSLDVHGKVINRRVLPVGFRK